MNDVHLVYFHYSLQNVLKVGGSLVDGKPLIILSLNIGLHRFCVFLKHEIVVVFVLKVLVELDDEFVVHFRLVKKLSRYNLAWVLFLQVFSIVGENCHIFLESGVECLVLGQYVVFRFNFCLAIMLNFIELRIILLRLLTRWVQDIFLFFLHQILLFLHSAFWEGLLPLRLVESVFCLRQTGKIYFLWKIVK